LELIIPLSNNIDLNSILNIPLNPKYLIIFVHGSGSNSSSPRNNYVASILNDNGFATLLTNLLTLEEQCSDIKSQKIIGKFPGIVLNKFNINLLSSRLTSITNWIMDDNNVSSELSAKVKDLPIGYFGASTGTAAAIEATAVVASAYAYTVSNTHSNKIYAIVSRGGRPDLSGSDALKTVKAATLLIVGAEDSKEIISLNKNALKQLKNAKYKDLVIIPNTGHLFEESGALERVAEITKQWFTKNLIK
jgi:putative phosphoribosyl transferase